MPRRKPTAVYWGVNLNKVWQTVQEDVPLLIDQVSAAITALESGEGRGS